MRLIISVDHPKITLELFENDQTIDSLSWEDNNDLSVNLLSNLDQLLRRHNTSVNMLESVEVQVQQASFTAARIAETVAKTINLYLKNGQ